MRRRTWRRRIWGPRRWSLRNWGKALWGWAALAVATAMAVGAAPAAAQQGAYCQNASQTCAAMLSPECRRLGASATGIPGGGTAQCDGEFGQYRDCLSEAARVCGSNPAPSPENTAGAGGGNRDQARIARYCQGELDHCLDTVEQSYAGCRDGADSSCRGDCQAERVRVRDRCNDNHRSCLTLETFNTVSFEDPTCLRDTRTVNDPLGQAPDPTQNWQQQPVAPAMGMVCRNGYYYCIMNQAGPIGYNCTCFGNPAYGVPPFQGSITFE